MILISVSTVGLNVLGVLPLISWLSVQIEIEMEVEGEGEVEHMNWNICRVGFRNHSVCIDMWCRCSFVLFQ